MFFGSSHKEQLRILCTGLFIFLSKVFFSHFMLNGILRCSTRYMTSPEQLIHWCYLGCKIKTEAEKHWKHNQKKKKASRSGLNFVTSWFNLFLRDFKSPRKLECAFSRNQWSLREWTYLSTHVKVPIHLHVNLTFWTQIERTRLTTHP